MSRTPDILLFLFQKSTRFCGVNNANPLLILLGLFGLFAIDPSPKGISLAISASGLISELSGGAPGKRRWWDVGMWILGSSSLELELVAKDVYSCIYV